MPVIRIPQPLQNMTGGKAEIVAEGATAGELLKDLERQFNGISKRLMDDNGKLRRFVNVYLNDEDIRFLENLDTKVSENDTLSIVPAIAGGVKLGDEGNAKKKFYLTFPQELIKRPILWELMNEFDVIVNIRTATVSKDIGLVGMELEGPQDQIEAARQWLEGLNVHVEPVEMNVIE